MELVQNLQNDTALLEKAEHEKFERLLDIDHEVLKLLRFILTFWRER